MRYSVLIPLEQINHKIVLHDDTLRDGEQAPGVSFGCEQKLELTSMLLGSGVQYINLGFPAVSEDEAETIKTICKAFPDAPGLSCLARAREADVSIALKTGIGLVSMFIPTSDLLLASKMKCDADTAFAMMRDGIQIARSQGARVRYAFEDATRTPLERLKRFCEGALEFGASTITICDTVGELTPISAFNLIKELVAITGPEVIAVHFHNDLGMATANTIAGMAAGAYMLQGTLTGIGERCGNATTEQLAAILQFRYGLSIVNLESLLGASRYVAQLTGVKASPLTPLLGDNAFAHESGIHVQGLLSNPQTYQPFSPSEIGRQHEIRFGKHSGLSNIQWAAKNHNITLPEDAAIAALTEVKRRSQAGRAVSESDVVKLLKQLLSA